MQKDAKGAIAHTNKGVVRRMIVMNEPFPQATAQRFVFFTPFDLLRNWYMIKIL